MGNEKGRKKNLPKVTKKKEMEGAQLDTRKKRKISRTIINALMGDKDAPRGMKNEGLIAKALRILNTDLDGSDSEIQHKSIDKIIKLLPYVVSKESNPIMNIFNNQKISTTLVTSDLVSLQDYIANRHKTKLVGDNLETDVIEEAEVIEELLPELEYEDEEDEDGTEDEIEETGGATIIEEQPIETEPEEQTEDGVEIGSGEGEENKEEL